MHGPRHDSDLRQKGLWIRTGFRVLGKSQLLIEIWLLFSIWVWLSYWAELRVISLASFRFCDIALVMPNLARHGLVKLIW